MASRLGRVASATIVLATMLASVAGTSTTAAAGSRNSPQGKVLILSNNLFDTPPGDARHTGDMSNFVDRTLNFAPFVPDVLLLQEVRAKSVEAVRSFITRRTGQKFVTVVDAGHSPWKKLSNSRVLGNDVAIVMNSETMRLAGDKGRIRHPYKHKFAKPGSQVKIKQTAYALLEELGSPSLKVPVASLHYPKQREFSSERVSQTLKAGFTKQIVDKLSSKWPGSEYKRTIGGDFNNFRCMSAGSYGTGGSANCNQTPLYEALTHRHGYKDSVFALDGTLNPIDFVFTTANVVNAKWDKGASKNPSSANFYSNHDLRWALIEGPDTTPPTSPNEVRRYAGFGGYVQLGHWDPSRDGGTGLKHYEIWRSRGLSGNDFSFVAAANDNGDMFKDFQVQKGSWYQYKVRAVDEAGNYSETKTLEVRAGD